MRREYVWTELDYVAGADHELHMSYGKYVSAGCPNLQRFKRRVESGEFDPRPDRTKRIKLKEGVSPGGRKIETTITCKQCGVKFTYVRFGGPVKEYCPECRLIRMRESTKRQKQRERERERSRKVGAINGAL